MRSFPGKPAALPLQKAVRVHCDLLSTAWSISSGTLFTPEQLPTLYKRLLQQKNYHWRLLVLYNHQGKLQFFRKPYTCKTRNFLNGRT